MSSNPSALHLLFKQIDFLYRRDRFSLDLQLIAESDITAGLALPRTGFLEQISSEREKEIKLFNLFPMKSYEFISKKRKGKIAEMNLLKAENNE